MNKVLIATTNKGKIAEFKKLFSNFDVDTLSLEDFPTIEEPAEDGKTFEENSIIKAKYYGEKFKISTIADDSGFCVKALDNFPGIHSARMVPNKDYKNYGAKLLQDKLKEKNTNDLSAFFVCNITFYDYDLKKSNSFEGSINGNLTFPPVGDNGFGYDPMFTPNGYTKTFGEMDIKEKNKISHRAVALEKFKEWFIKMY